MYPQVTDVRDYLAARGVSAPADAVLARYLDSAVTEFESLTGYKPFLAEATPSTYYYNAAGRWHDLEAGYVEIVSVEVITDVETMSGQALAAGSDYIALPLNGLPKNLLYFPMRLGFAPLRLKVRGRRGYSDAVPAEVFNAILWRAATFVLGQVQGSLTAVKEGDVSLQFAEGDTAGAEAREYRRTVQRYRRVAYGAVL